MAEVLGGGDLIRALISVWLLLLPGQQGSMKRKGFLVIPLGTASKSSHIHSADAKSGWNSSVQWLVLVSLPFGLLAFVLPHFWPSSSFTERVHLLSGVMETWTQRFAWRNKKMIYSPVTGCPLLSSLRQDPSLAFPPSPNPGVHWAQGAGLTLGSSWTLLHCSQMRLACIYFLFLCGLSLCGFSLCGVSSMRLQNVLRGVTRGAWPLPTWLIGHTVVAAALFLPGSHQAFQVTEGTACSEPA